MANCFQFLVFVFDPLMFTQHTGLDPKRKGRGQYCAAPGMLLSHQNQCHPQKKPVFRSFEIEVLISWFGHSRVCLTWHPLIYCHPGPQSCDETNSKRLKLVGATGMETSNNKMTSGTRNISKLARVASETWDLQFTDWQLGAS